jgi:hypothetical protein
VIKDKREIGDGLYFKNNPSKLSLHEYRNLAQKSMKMGLASISLRG